jgi:crotonobetainyl-CoA:carnitine CoA-transferase CaiB-like acyl-CoA transferase
MDARPLAGFRVLDFSHAAAGPYATMYMADMGAEVIKIEKPGRGDGARFMGTPLLSPTDSDFYVGLNRNKKDLLLDLGMPEGVALAKRLAAISDIVVQNFRPGVMDRLGLGFDDLRKLRPGLIYTSISAFGPTGPWSGQPANDIIVQSMSGLMAITGEVGGGPVRIGAAVTDYSSGLFALSGTLAALLVRDQHPEGQHVEVAMLDSAIALMSNYVPSIMAGKRKRIPRVGRGHAQIVPYQAFPCSDGEYVMVGAFTNSFWRRLATALGHPEWPDDPMYLTNAERLANRDELIPKVEAIFRTQPRAHWLEVLKKADVPTSPVYELHEAIRSEQAVHNKIVKKVEDDDVTTFVVRSPIRVAEWASDAVDTPAPRMGRDTQEVLVRVLGLDAVEVARLAEAGVVGLEQRDGEIDLVNVEANPG